MKSGSCHPEEEPALGPRPRGVVSEEAFERVEHRVAALAIDPAQILDVLAPAPLGEVLTDEVLGQGRGAEVRGLLAERDLLDHRRRSAQPADPDPRGEDLRQRADVDDVVATLEPVQRLACGALVAEQPVRVVLDQQQLAGAEDLDQAPAPLERHRHAGGILKAGHRVDELRTSPLPGEPVEQRLERIDAHPLGVDLHLHGLGLIRAEDRNRTGVRRRLGDHDIAGVDQRLRDQVDRLLASGGDDQVVEVRVHSLGPHQLADALLGLREALGRSVLERLGRALLSDPRHLGGKGLGREGRGVRESTGERDHLRARGDLHQVPHRARPHHPGALGEQPRVALEVAGRRVGSPVRAVSSPGVRDRGCDPRAGLAHLQPAATARLTCDLLVTYSDRHGRGVQGARRPHPSRAARPSVRARRAVAERARGRLPMSRFGVMKHLKVLEERRAW